MEAEAVLLILGRCEAGAWQWLSSAVVEEEVNNTPSHERRARVRQMLSGAHGTIALTDVAIARAQALKAMGLRTYDALHLACAEQATVDVFLTTDDRVLRIATRHTAPLNVQLTVFGFVTSVPQRDEHTHFNIYANDEQPVSAAQSDSEDETDRERGATFERAFRALFPAIQGMEKFTSFHHYPRVVLHPIAVYRDLAVKGDAQT